MKYPSKLFIFILLVFRFTALAQTVQITVTGPATYSGSTVFVNGEAGRTGNCNPPGVTFFAQLGVAYSASFVVDNENTPACGTADGLPDEISVILGTTCYDVYVNGSKTSKHKFPEYSREASCVFEIRPKEEVSVGPETVDGSYTLVADGNSVVTPTVAFNNSTWTFVGDSLGCQFIDDRGTVRAGYQEGTVIIRAGTGCMYTAAIELTKDCGGCKSADCNHGAMGAPSASMGSIHFKLGLGWASVGNSAGFLLIDEEEVSSELYTSKKLRYPYVRNTNEVHAVKKDGCIRQIKTPEGLINVVSNDASSYFLYVYHKTNRFEVQPDGLYRIGVSDEWLTRFTIKNEDNDLNKFRVVQRFPGGDPITLYKYNRVSDSTYAGWELETGDGASLRKETKLIASFPLQNQRTETTSVSNATALVSYRFERYETNTYTTPPSGTRKEVKLKELTIGTGSDAITTTYLYTSTGHLEQLTRSDGYWEYNVFDTKGRVIKSMYPYKDSGFDGVNNSSLYRVIEHTYANVFNDGEDLFTVQTNTARMTVEKVLGHEVRRSYTKFVGKNQRQEIVCLNPSDSFNATGRLVTTNWIATNGMSIHLNGLKSVFYPDGTVLLNDFGTYAIGINGNVPKMRTNVVMRGVPSDLNYTNISMGTKTTTIIGAAGQILTNTVADVSAQVRIAREINTYDYLNRLVQTTFLDGTTTERTYDCACGLLSSFVDRDGTVNNFTYDAMKRRLTATMPLPSGGTITNENVYDADGNITATKRHGTGGTVVTTSSSSYDTAGRLFIEWDGEGRPTTNLYSIATGKLVKTKRFANGSERIETYYKDGRLEKITGTATAPVYYEYGVEQDGDHYREFTKEYKHDSVQGSEWVKSYKDGAGRIYKMVASNGAVTEFHYNAFGQLAKKKDGDGVTELYQYNSLGEREFTVVDMDGDGVVDPLSDRRSQTIDDVVASSNLGENMRRKLLYVWDTENSDASTLVARALTSVNGLTNFITVWHNGNAVTTSNRTVYAGSGRVIVTNWIENGAYSVVTNRYGKVESETSYNSSGGLISQKIYQYDGQGRMNRITDLFSGTTTNTYNNADQITSFKTPAPGVGQASQMTTNLYDNMGRLWITTHPDGTSVTNEYHLNGLLKRTYGSRTYPVGFGYDAQGRMTKMTNWTSFSSGGGERVTTWQYDSQTGRLVNKLYDGQQGPSYTYTAGGRLETRQWARLLSGQRITTTYKTNAAGDLAAIVYSDGTTGVTNTYDRAGRLAEVLHGDVTTIRSYSEANLLLSERYTGGLLDGLGVTNTFDSATLRRTNLLTKAGKVGYSFGGALRMSRVTSGANTFGYSYVNNSATLVGSVLQTNAGTRRLAMSYSYDKLGRLTDVESAMNGTVGSSFAYQYNNANQRTRRTEFDNSYWVYEYDELGQVTSGKKFWGDGTPVAGQQFGYNFDDIGNRESTASGGNEFGTELRHASYTVNAQNQITSRTVPGFVDLWGTATNNATVTVNDQPTSRKGDFWRAELAVNNSSAGVNQPVTTLAVQKNGTNPDKVESVTGNIYVPQATQSFTYDADGNMISDGQWTFTWNAENRMTKAVRTGATVDYTYDYAGRLVSRKETVGSNEEFLLFVYDGTRCVVEVDGASGANKALVRSYVWGLDLSGSMDGAGGVGGLLAVTLHSSGPTHCPFYDGNGNVVGLARADTATITANYEYDPFGRTTRVEGTRAKENLFRFSTKRIDPFTDHMLYEYRVYNVASGTWLSRDPIEEAGGANLYNYALNNPILRYDKLGLTPISGGNGQLFIPQGGFDPEIIRDAWFTAASEFVKGEFAQRLLRNYIWGGGARIHLTKEEVQSILDPQVSLLDNIDFMKLVVQVCASRQPHRMLVRLTPFDRKNNSGGLGTYSIFAHVTVDCCNGEWSARGKAFIYDDWDFDWTIRDVVNERIRFWRGGVDSDPANKGRHWRTMWGSAIPGTGFPVVSESIEVQQQSGGRKLIWSY